MSRKYPLAALSTLRAATAERCARDLADAEAARASDEAALARARVALVAAHTERREAEALARERLQAGSARVVDLERAADERRAQNRVITELEQRAESALRQLERSEQLCTRARAALAQAQAEERALEEHHRAFRQREELARTELADEEALERWTSERIVRSGRE
ncbi:MAG: hypothetical protein ACOY0T_08885 [Myxococcota bacterium]